MATTKSSAKASPAKRSAPAKGVAKAKTTATTAKPKPVVKAGAAKAAVPKAAPKTAAVKPKRASAKKSAGIPPEQRRNYIEMAAYYIAERRGFAPGNPLEDWIQAEAEIDRLLAEGRLGQ
ncbi:MAG: DUF2934 domain-containing protein [Sulfuritalea sp.]|nr:DUF2934 domain-containing protein [Sulfuritalea sp.]